MPKVAYRDIKVGALVRLGTCSSKENKEISHTTVKVMEKYSGGSGDANIVVSVNNKCHPWNPNGYYCVYVRNIKSIDISPMQKALCYNKHIQSK